MTPAEQRAREFAKRFEGFVDFDVVVETRYYDGFKLEGEMKWVYPPSTRATFSVHEKLAGGHMWASWVTSHYDGTHITTTFDGGRYQWTFLGRSRRIRRSLPHLRRVIDTMVEAAK